MRNAMLLEQVMQQIKDHPELHDQGPFFSQKECGTAACFGGWACLLSGYTPNRYGYFATAITPSGDIVQPWEEAQCLLGLSSEEADTLFSPSNTRHALEMMVKDLVNGAELQPWEDYQ